MKISHAAVSSLTIACALQGGTTAAFAPSVGSHPRHNTKTGSSSTTAALSSLWNPRSFSTTTGSPTALLDSKMDQSFKTWSYDKPCMTMAWTEPVDVSISVQADATAASVAEGADLIVIGVMAPAKAEESSADEDAEEKDVPVMELTGLAKAVDDSLGGALQAVLAENVKTFQNGAKMGNLTPTIRVVQNGTVKRYALLGLGTTPKAKADEKDDKEKKEDLFMAAGFALGKAISGRCHAEKKVTSCTVLLPTDLATREKLVQDFSTEFYQSLYVDNRFRTGSKIKKPVEDLKTVVLASEGAALDTATVAAAVEQGKALATGIFLTKDIVNAPHNVLNALSLADTAKRIAAESKGRIKCTILGKNECEKRGMGAFLGVARGSEVEPQFIHLTYTPPPSSGKATTIKKVGVIGKGLLFDTGGYNIKTSMMELMKFDCGGSAAVFGAARALAVLQPTGVEAHFIVAACDNMISGKAYKPSDILTASNGKTIEVMNTDAEGRLTLADALVFADKELGCESIIELSTLTGACMVSLGKQIAGVFTQNDDLAKELQEISKQTGDSSWRMPMAKEYKEQLESKFADMKNIGGKYGGAITAALFLQNFVSAKKPFAHIDIAGPVWSDKEGATGYGAKLVAEWVTRQGKKVDAESAEKK